MVLPPCSISVEKRWETFAGRGVSKHVKLVIEIATQMPEEWEWENFDESSTVSPWAEARRLREGNIADVFGEKNDHTILITVIHGSLE